MSIIIFGEERYEDVKGTLFGKSRFCLWKKHVIVTGASGGLGKALTLQLIRHYHCRVLGVGRSEETLQALRQELGEYAEQFAYRVFDVSCRESWQALAEEVQAGNIQADVLINNAGMLPPFTRFDSYSLEELDRYMTVNFTSVLYASQVFLPLLAQQGGGAIVNIASSDALCPLVGTSIYSAGKAGVKALSEVMREEYRGKVYIPVVCPGFIRTNIMQHQSREVSPMVHLVSMPADKAARLILERVNRQRSRIVTGADAHFMSLAYRIAPVCSLRFLKRVLKVSGLALFADIYQ